MEPVKKLSMKTEERGSILILVLWSLFFLTLLVVGLSHRVEGDMNLALHLKLNSKIRMLAKAGTVVAIQQVLNDPSADYDTLNESWHRDDGRFKRKTLGQGFYSVYSGAEMEGFGLTDEESKININTADIDTLKRLFVYAAEINANQASALAASVVDWRDVDSISHPGGAEESFYGYLDPPYPCKDQDFQVLEELLVVKGFAGGIYEKIKGFITVYGDGYVNINTASLPVLLALGFSEDLSLRILSFREGEDGEAETSDDGAFVTTAEIAERLDEQGDLSLAQLDQINKILDNDLITVKSGFFSALSVGALPNEKYYRIRFIFNRNGETVYWHEG